MKKTDYCVFDTPLGCCAIAWTDDGAGTAVTYFQLPEATPRLTEARIARHCGAGRACVPPPPVATLVERVRKHLEGDTQDFRDILLDLEGVGPFARRVYEAARQIPAGQTRSYGELARAIGHPTAARAVGQALGKNPVALLVPCHRILTASGKVGGFSAYGGCVIKTRLLALEGTELAV